MKKKLLVIALLFAIIGAVSAQEWDYVEIVNETGLDIYFVQISHEYSDEWEEDLIEFDVLMTGESILIELTDFPTPIFDIRLIDEDGDTYTIWGVNVAYEDLIITLDDLDYQKILYILRFKQNKKRYRLYDLKNFRLLLIP